jgi:hypothetical protein
MGVDSATTEVFGPEIKIKTFFDKNFGANAWYKLNAAL